MKKVTITIEKSTNDIDLTRAQMLKSINKWASSMPNKPTAKLISITFKPTVTVYNIELTSN